MAARAVHIFNSCTTVSYEQQCLACECVTWTPSVHSPCAYTLFHLTLKTRMHLDSTPAAWAIETDEERDVLVFCGRWTLDLSAKPRTKSLPFVTSFAFVLAYAIHRVAITLMEFQHNLTVFDRLRTMHRFVLVRIGFQNWRVHFTKTRFAEKFPPSMVDSDIWLVYREEPLFPHHDSVRWISPLSIRWREKSKKMFIAFDGLTPQLHQRDGHWPL